jgi:NAD(P)-dependent dehydrogenase (short-subunit alcohol dehydrogenase family)
MDFVGKRAVVTGGASGIGRALAYELVQRGYRVILADIDGAKAEAAAAELGPQAVGTMCDVRNHNSVRSLATYAEQELGAVDLVFANAGVSLGGPLIEATPAEFDWIFGINVRGAWSTVAVFAQQMIMRGHRGRICVTASEHALGLQHPGAGFYTATKQALLGLTDIFRAELPPTVSISAFCPGLVSTEIHLSRRRGPRPPIDPAREAFAGEIMARGMPAREAAVAAVEGALRGDFLIVTHPGSRTAAETRFADITAAFERQAPGPPESDPYDVRAAIAAATSNTIARTRRGS